MREHVEVRTGAYADSVTLMQVSRRVAEVDGVEAALVAMATDLNLDVLASMGFELPDASVNDLLVAIRGEEEAVVAALDELQAALDAARGSGSVSFGDGPVPRTVRDAIRGGANLALVSVPGEHAYAEARDAIEAGVHVMLFSDNVPIELEVDLKRRAAVAGTLVMGPDAGTAIVAGLGLGFANVVRPGPVGIVAASGTGAQHLSCLLDDGQVGVSHILGVGGRDLRAEVGGASSRMALAALDADPSTELIVLLSKPPDPQVARELGELTGGLATPVVEALLGADAADLTSTAREVVRRMTGGDLEVPSWAPSGSPDGGFDELRGLFAGGSLCDEAMVIATRILGRVRSNIPLDADDGLTDGLDTPGHVLVDLGEDEFTRGRPHPMIDHSLRVARITHEAARPGRRVLLLDVVLGHGAHPDPAAELSGAIGQAVADGHAVVVSLCAAAGDPQDRRRQARALADAGASVFCSNAQAARHAAELVGGGA